MDCLNVVKRRILAAVVMSSTINMVACQKPGSVAPEAANRSVASLSAQKIVAADGIKLISPQYVMLSVKTHFSLVSPAGLTIANAQWDFGDGSAPVQGVGPLDYQFFTVGQSVVTVNLTDSLGQQASVSQTITVMPYDESIYCVGDLLINAPTQATAGESLPMSVTIPDCLNSFLKGVQWDLGDGSAQLFGPTQQYAYTMPGTYTVTATVLVNNNPENTTTLTLTAEVVVSQPAPSPQPDPTPAPAPTPTPTPPVDPLACPEVGLTRQTTGANYNEVKTCGMNGHETDIYHDVSTQTCQYVNGDILRWGDAVVVKTLVTKGQCEGQSCALPEGGTLADGGSRTYYSSQSPAGSCSSASQVRSCSNGVLSGSSSFNQLTCQSGCDGFGPNGTVHPGIVTGQITVAHACAFGETGINDIYSQVADQTCNNGTVTTGNARQGGLVSTGVCPVYQWAATQNFTACSADCGGQQSQIFECHDAAGAVVPNDHCAGSSPVVTRVCDGNPDAVKRSDVETTPDGDGSTNICPANQIGVIVKHRDHIETTNYACIDHAVGVASVVESYSPWITDSYCRDYVSYRCSQDSLDNTQAAGRYDWMMKCADSVPVIKEFLTEFASVKSKDSGHGSFSLGDQGRVLYPTFMYRKSVSAKANGANVRDCTRDGKDIPWIAPTTKTASCNVPASVYVAAVCVSSCATPEQQIMAQIDANSKMTYQPIVESWQKKFEFVATLRPDSSINSKQVQKTKVDQWVTELMDTDHEIIEFHMQSGGTLRLTPNHPLLGSDGIMKRADGFVVGENLVQLGGKTDPITSIVHTNYYGKVYNLFVKSADLRQNVVVTNGYLNGTAFYQNEGGQYMNRTILRGRLTEGVFGK